MRTKNRHFNRRSTGSCGSGFRDHGLLPTGGLILVRELDERLGFGELIDEHRTDSRANNARFSLADLLRQSVYSRLAGYEDVNDAERLSQDSTFPLALTADRGRTLLLVGSVGGQQWYTSPCRRTKKLIPVQYLEDGTLSYAKSRIGLLRDCTPTKN